MCVNIVQVLEYSIWNLNGTNRKTNLYIARHGFCFEEAIPAFYGEYRIDFEDISADEERYNLIGMALGVTFFVVYTFREVNSVLKTRIISVRKAVKHEQKQYKEYYR